MKYIRTSKSTQIYQDKLAAEGFHFCASKDPKQYVFDQTIAALTAYKKIHRNFDIKYTFRVPENDANYPENTWGIVLGSCELSD